MSSVLAALGAAACFALATALQHRGAVAAPAGRGVGFGLLLELLASPLWLAGLVVGAAGLALNTYALAVGRLLVVQPLLVSGLVFTLVVAAVLDGRRPAPGETAWAAAVAAGLCLFLLGAVPAAGLAVAPGGRLAVALVVAAATVGLALLLATVPGARATSLGAAAGCCFGVTAVLLKQLTGLAGSGLVPLLRSWPACALVAAGLLGIALAQSAYQAGPLAASVPALTVVEPVVAAAIGALAFGEVPSGRPGALLAQALGAALVVLGAVRLATAVPQTASLPAPDPGAHA